MAKTEQEFDSQLLTLRSGDDVNDEGEGLESANIVVGSVMRVDGVGLGALGHLFDSSGIRRKSRGWWIFKGKRLTGCCRQCLCMG